MNTVALRQKRAAVLGEARAITDKALNEKRALTAEEQSAWDAKIAEADQLKNTIETIERQAKLEAENAVSVSGPMVPVTAPTPNATVEVRENQPKRSGLADAVRAIAFGGKDRRVSAQFAEETLHNPELARALAASVAATGGFAVPTILAEEFIEFLRPAAVVRAAGARQLPMPNGNLSLPKITGGAVATWIGENSNIGATQQVLGQVKLIAKKLAAVIPISNDLIRYANPQTDGVIRADLIRAVAQAEDFAFLLGQGTQFSPQGMYYWALPSSFVIAPALTESAQDITNITEFLGSMIANLLQANVPVTLESGVFFFSPRSFVYLKTLRNPTTGQYAFPELQGADPRLLGYKVAYTSQIPINLVATPSGGAQANNCSECFFANMPDMIIGESANLMLDVSSEAAYVDGNGNTISAFSQDQTVIRVIEENDFAVRYQQSISVGTAMTF